MSENSSIKRQLNILVIFLIKSDSFLLLNEREMLKVLFNTKSCYIYCSKVSLFYELIICLLDIAHRTSTLEEFLATVKGFVAVLVRQLCLFTTLEM